LPNFPCNPDPSSNTHLKDAFVFSNVAWIRPFDNKLSHAGHFYAPKRIISVKSLLRRQI